LYFIYSFERRRGGGNHSTEFSQGPQFLINNELYDAYS
jgi:hypothetical protein